MAKKLRIHQHFNRGYGWKRPSLPLQRDIVSLTFSGPIPSAVDLRPSCPPIYDQLDLGSCTANALGALAEFLMMKAGKKAFIPSRLFIYYNERAMEGSIGEDAGASISDGAYVISNLGCPNEAIWWYNTQKFKVKPNKRVYADGLQNVVFGVAGVRQNLDEMKKVLAAGTPIVVGFTVYDSFESDAVTKTGIVPMPGRWETVLGGHAVVVVGYDDAKKWWIVRNSWGSDWADHGYFYMPYSYLTNPWLADDFWTGLSIGPSQTIVA